MNQQNSLPATQGAYITDNDMGGVLIHETGGGTYVTEGGATDSYQIALATEPSGPVEITVSADSQVEISNDGGATFGSTLVLSFSDTTPEGEGEAVSVARRVWMLESPAGTTHVGASVWNQPEGAPGRMAGSHRPDEARMEWLVQAAEEARRRPAWPASQTVLRSGRRSQTELTDELESLLDEAARARLQTAPREHAELDAFFSALDNEL